MKATEDFADVILKMLNPGIPYSKVHPQKLKLIEKLKVREAAIRNDELLKYKK